MFLCAVSNCIFLISKTARYHIKSLQIMVFAGRLDILVISADLAGFVLDDEAELYQTFVNIVIDDIEVGSTAVVTGSRPQWRENFTTELSSMMELRAGVYRKSGAEEEKLVSECVVTLGDLRQKQPDGQTINCTLEMKPRGQIIMEVTFHPRQTKLRRKKAMYESVNIDVVLIEGCCSR